VFDVDRQLRDQGVDAVELALTAEELGEADLGGLAVEILVEVEEMRLEQRVIGVFVERRAPPEVDRTGVGLARRALAPAGVDTVGRAGTARWSPRRWRSEGRASAHVGRR
jgi:hypothetical protein